MYGLSLLCRNYQFTSTLPNCQWRFPYRGGRTSIASIMRYGIWYDQARRKRLMVHTNIEIGSFVGGAASSKKNLTSQTLIAAACLILLGCGLLSTLHGGREFYTPTYGYQVILGVGVGLTMSSATLLTNLSSKAEDVGMWPSAFNNSWNDAFSIFEQVLHKGR